LLNGSGTVTNLSGGTITASGNGAAGVAFGNGTNTLNNFGTISATNINGIGVSIGGAGDYTNAGVIQPRGGASKRTVVHKVGGSGTAVIVNSGTINANDASSTNYGVIGESGSTLNITNSSTGTISATGSAGTGIQLDTNSFATNNGMIVVGTAIGATSGIGIV